MGRAVREDGRPGRTSSSSARLASLCRLLLLLRALLRLDRRVEGVHFRIAEDFLRREGENACRCERDRTGERYIDLPRFKARRELHL